MHFEPFTTGPNRDVVSLGPFQVRPRVRVGLVVEVPLDLSVPALFNTVDNLLSYLFGDKEHVLVDAGHVARTIRQDAVRKLLDVRRLGKHVLDQLVPHFNGVLGLEKLPAFLLHTAIDDRRVANLDKPSAMEIVNPLDVIRNLSQLMAVLAEGRLYERHN